MEGSTEVADEAGATIIVPQMASKRAEFVVKLEVRTYQSCPYLIC
jgi:hypothetical protein